MVIEFYGLPGSGKTTVAKMLAERDGRFIYLHTSPRREMLRYVPLFFARHPRTTIFWMREVFVECRRFRFRELFRYKLHLFLISIVQYQKARGRKDTISLVDEGLYQRTLSFYETEKNREGLERCVSHIPKPDMVVLMRNRETEFFRFLNSPHRHESPRLRLGPSYFENWMDVVRKNDVMVREVIKEGRVPAVLCDDTTAEDCSQKVYEAIARYAKNR